MEEYTLQLLIRSLKGAVAALEMEYDLKKKAEKTHAIIIVDINQKSS